MRRLPNEPRASVARTLRDARDRPLGARAIRTRRRLLEATAALLGERGLRGASVVEIARRAETSPACFYQYFPSVEDAVVELLDDAAPDMLEIVALLDGPFAGAAGLANARVLVARFLDLWDAHRTVFRVRNHGADEGTLSYRRAWRAALRPLLDAIARRLGADALPSRRANPLHPYAAAAALATVLESIGAHHRELEFFGVGRDDLVETSARLLVDTIALASETAPRRR
jgi:AcrR family transcriptional regulator